MRQWLTHDDSEARAAKAGAYSSPTGTNEVVPSQHLDGSCGRGRIAREDVQRRRAVCFCSLLSQRFGLSRGFLQNIGRYFPDGEMEFEHRRFCAASPTVDLPVRADELHVTARAEVE
jgi:hypothetical protein